MPDGSARLGQRPSGRGTSYPSASQPGRGGRLLAEVHRGMQTEGGCCWAWRVWSPAGGPRGMHAGMTDTLADAKAAAERALLSEVASRRERVAWP